MKRARTPEESDDNSSNRVLIARSTTLEDMYDSCVATAQKTAPVMALPPAECFLLLSRCSLDPEQLQTDYYDDNVETGQMNGEKWKEELKLWDSTSRGYPAACAASETDDVTLAANTEPVECAICCTEDLQPGNAFAMCNDHWLCVGCWRNNLTVTVKEGRNRSVVIRCYDPQCSAMMLPHHLSPIHTQHAALKAAINPHDFDLYLRKTWFPQVREAAKGRYEECHDGNCTGMFTIDQLPLDKKTDAQLECDSCHMSTCLRCLKVDHAPCNCEQQEEWDQYARRHDMDALWVEAHTKKCPRCGKSIEKNQGCNHMTCTQCRYEFCWICLGDWARHTGGFYNCTNAPPAAITSANSTARQHSDAFNQTANAYNSHLKSADKDKDALKSLLNKIGRHEGEDMSHLRDTALVLRQCRNLLAHMYVWQFLATNEEKKKILATNQGQLFVATEELSLLVSLFRSPYLRQMHDRETEPTAAEVRSKTAKAKRMIEALHRAIDTEA